MKMQLGLAGLFLGVSVMAQGLVSSYSSIELKKCSNYQEGEGGVSADCQGPDGVVLEFSAGDWTNMWINYKGKRLETWNLLIAGGSFTRIGGDNQVVEWILDKSVEGTSRVHSLIARVGVTNPQTQVNSSKLLVFGFSSLGVCYRGDSTSNLGARQIAESSQCLKNLPMTLPKPPSLKNRYQSIQTQNQQPRELVTETRRASITSIFLQHGEVTPDGKGTFEIEVKYCQSNISKSEAEIDSDGKPSAVQNVTLGGAYSTLQTFPMKLTYTIEIPKGVAVADLCKENSMMLKLHCDIKPGYGGAGCNFKVNNQQIIAVESFKNGYNNAMLLPVQ